MNIYVVGNMEPHKAAVYYERLQCKQNTGKKS